MFLDDMFIMRLTKAQMDNFIDFGYTVEANVDENGFAGRIHRFAVFCDEYTGDVSYETIRIHNFKDVKPFKVLNSKIMKIDLYKEYESNNGEPVLNQKEIKEKRYGL